MAYMDFAGDFKLTSIVIHGPQVPSLDVRDLMLELNVYESVHASNLYGNLVMRDNANHVQNIPLVGQEDIEFVFSTNDDSKNENIDFLTFRGRIYKVSDNIRTAERDQVYTLHFTTQETLRNHRTRVKSAYEGSGDEIAERILKNLLKSKKQIYVEPSDLYVKLLGNNMKPYEFLSLLAKRCRSRVFEGAGYLFFENHRGFQFRSWESLNHSANKERPIMETYIVEHRAIAGTIEQNMKSVIEYKITKQQDVLAASASGLLASTHYVYDLNTKSYEKIEHQYDKLFNDMKHIEFRNPGALYTTTPEEEDGSTLFDFPEQRIHLSSKDKKLHTQSTTDTRDYNNHRDQLQVALHNRLSHDQITVSASVPGNSNLAAGDPINLLIPSFEPTYEGTRIFDAFLSGRWILVNVVHSVSNTGYSTTFDCVKDSVAQPYANADLTIKTSTDYHEVNRGIMELNTANDN